MKGSIRAKLKGSRADITEVIVALEKEFLVFKTSGFNEDHEDGFFVWIAVAPNGNKTGGGKE